MPYGQAKGMGMVPMLIGAGLLVGLMVALLSGGARGEGNLTPIPPQPISP
jgi:hypothetical protein